MVSKEDLVKVGYIKRTHGFQGNIQIHLSKKVILSEGDFLFLSLDNLPIPFKLLEVKGNEAEPILHLEFVSDHDKAKSLIGTELFIQPDRIEEETELTLIGFTLVDKKLSTLGKVLDVLQMPKQDLLLINYNGKECYVPFTEDFINYISMEDKEIWMDLPDGILEI